MNIISKSLTNIFISFIILNNSITFISKHINEGICSGKSDFF